MSDPQVPTSEATLKALQTRLTWMKRALLLVAVLFGGAVLLGQSSNHERSEVTAKKISIVDVNGKTVVEIGSSRAGAPYMMFTNGEKILLNCRASRGGYPFFALSDATGQSVATLQTGMGDQPGAHLFLENKKTKARKHYSTETHASRRAR